MTKDQIYEELKDRGVTIDIIKSNGRSRTIQAISWGEVEKKAPGFNLDQILNRQDDLLTVWDETVDGWRSFHESQIMAAM